MPTDDLSKLSPEQLQKLSKTINDAKALTNQQAEIIERVIAGETDIGKLRISYLKEYFDTYSRSLDVIARRQSELNDAFLILDKELGKSYQRITADSAKAVEQLINTADTVVKRSADATAAIAKANGELEEAEAKVKSAKEAAILDDNKSSTGQGKAHSEKADDGSTRTETLFNELLSNFNNIAKYTASGGSNGTGHGADVENKLTDDKRNSLGTVGSNGNKLDDLTGVNKAIGNIFSALNTGSEEATRRALATAAEQQNTEISLAEYQQQEEKELIKNLAEEKQETTKLLMDLELARREAESDGAARLAEAQLAGINSVIKAELSAQELINEKNTSREFEASNEGVLLQERKKAAEDLQKSIQILEEQRLAYIENKKFEKERKLGRKLSAEESADIIKRANEKLRLDEQNLRKISALREKLGDEYFEKEKKYQETLLKLKEANKQDKDSIEARVQKAHQDQKQKVADSALSVRNLENDTNAYYDLTATKSGAKNELSLKADAEREASIQILKEQRLHYIERKRLELEAETGKKIEAAELARITRQANAEFALRNRN